MTLDSTSPIVLGPTSGTVIANPDGTVTYTPNGSFVGIDSFDYQACSSGNTQCDEATVTILVEPNNEPPVASEFVSL